MDNYKTFCEDIFGNDIIDYEENATGIVFQLAYPQAEIRFADLKKLSQKFGTDKINITTDFAYSDARGKYGMLIFIDFSMINFIKP